MGLTYLDLQVENPAAADTSESVRGLIDSGAIYSAIPTATLERLGIEPKGEQAFTLADGSTIRRKKGVALFRYGDRFGGADVIFGESGDSALIGATTLKALGLAFNPLARELYPLPMIMAAAHPRRA